MRKLVPGMLAGMLIALAMTGKAHAVSYDCDGGSNPIPNSHISTTVEINAPGACTISNTIDADGRD